MELVGFETIKQNLKDQIFKDTPSLFLGLNSLLKESNKKDTLRIIHGNLENAKKDFFSGILSGQENK